MKVEMKISGLNGVLETLKSLPPEIVSKRGGPVKLALKKGANVIRQQAAINLQSLIKGTNDDGERISTGLLLKNLVVTRGKAPASGNGERYLVRVRRKVYRVSGGESVTTLKTAQIFEYGSRIQPPRPFIRPAFNAKAAEAIQVTTDDLKNRIDKIVQKLAKKNRGR